MKIKGMNSIYEVEIKEATFEGKEGVEITARDSNTSISLIISKEDWKKIKEEI